MTKTNSFGTKVEAASSAPAQAPHTSGANLSDLEVLARLRAGDRKALEAVLAGARPRLTAVALKIVRNPDDAQDVVQDAMLKVWRYVGKFEGRSALSTWFHRIVVNTAVDYLRSRRYGVVVVKPADQDEEGHRHSRADGVSTETPEDLLAQAEVGAVVRGGIARLSLVHQQVLALRELEGDSYQEIAETVQCPIGTVMSRLHHARQRLAETLVADGLDLVGAQQQAA